MINEEVANSLAKTTLFVKDNIDEHIKQAQNITKSAFNLSDITDKISNIEMPELNQRNTTLGGAGLGALIGGVGMPLLQNTLSSGKKDNSSRLTTALLGSILGAGAGGGIGYLANNKPSNIKIKKGKQTGEIMPNQLNKAWNAENALSGSAASGVGATLGESGLIGGPTQIALGTAGLAGLNEILPTKRIFGRPLRDTLKPDWALKEVLSEKDWTKSPLVNELVQKNKLKALGEKPSASQLNKIYSLIKSNKRGKGLVGLGLIAAALGLGKGALSLRENQRLSGIENNINSKLED